MPLVHRRRLVAALATAAVTAAAATATIVVAAPAEAHPFGPPLSARLSVDGAEVAVTWTAAEDDWVNLGEFIGAFTGQTDQTGGTGEQLTGAELLARSDNLPSYLLSHFVIEQDGRPCDGQVTQLQDLLTLGAQLVYSCPEPVESVELTVTTLTDINENYRTVVTSGDTSALFTRDTATQPWTFDAAGGGTTRTALFAAGGLVLAAVAGAVLWWRRAAASQAPQTVEVTR